MYVRSLSLLFIFVLIYDVINNSTSLPQIAQDFEVLHKKASDKMFVTWRRLSEKLLHVAQREGKLHVQTESLSQGMNYNINITLRFVYFGFVHFSSHKLLIR